MIFTAKKYRNFTWFPGVEILRKGAVSSKFPHQKIRWNYGIFRSDLFRLSRRGLFTTKSKIYDEAFNESSSRFSNVSSFSKKPYLRFFSCKKWFRGTSLIFLSFPITSSSNFEHQLIIIFRSWNFTFVKIDKE